MNSNIMDNYFIYICISPRNEHYPIHDPIDMLIIESLNHCFTDFPQHFVIYFYNT